MLVKQINCLPWKKHIWSRSNHLTKSSNHLLTRGCKPLSKSDSKRNTGCSKRDGSHKVHNYWDDFDFLQSKFLSSLSSASASSLCLYINTWFAYLLCFYVCISGQWVAVTELLSESMLKLREQEERKHKLICNLSKALCIKNWVKQLQLCSLSFITQCSASAGDTHTGNTDVITAMSKTSEHHQRFPTENACTL